MYIFNTANLAVKYEQKNYKIRRRKSNEFLNQAEKCSRRNSITGCYTTLISYISLFPSA